jgi:hypothetical protein
VSAAFGDRRRHERLEVIGELRATFGAEPLLRIANIGFGGASVESEQPLAVLAVYQARLAVASEEADVHVRVRHVRRGESHPARYVIGLEFLGLSPAAASILERLLVASSDAAQEIN